MSTLLKHRDLSRPLFLCSLNWQSVEFARLLKENYRLKYVDLPGYVDLQGVCWLETGLSDKDCNLGCYYHPKTGARLLNSEVLDLASEGKRATLKAEIIKARWERRTP